jgi:hypothetical protein
LSFPTEWLPQGALLLFVVMWVCIAGVLSYVGGWHTLSQVYPDRGVLDGETFRFASMSLGKGIFPVNYGSCLSVRVGNFGIGLSPLLPFRLFHPPLFVPWSAISSCKVDKFLFIEQTSLYLVSPDTRLRFTGRAGRAIKQQHDRLVMEGRAAR